MMRLRIRIRVRVRVRLWVRIKVRVRVRVGIRLRVMALRVGNHVSFFSTSKTTSNYRFITRIKNDYTIEVKLAIEITIRKFKKDDFNVILLHSSTKPFDRDQPE